MSQCRNTSPPTSCLIRSDARCFARARTPAGFRCRRCERPRHTGLTCAGRTHGRWWRRRSRAAGGLSACRKLERGPKFHTDPELFALDMEAVFGRHWIFAATDTEIPDPGDYVTVDFGPYSVIVVHDDDQQVGAPQRLLTPRCAHPHGGARQRGQHCVRLPQLDLRHTRQGDRRREDPSLLLDPDDRCGPGCLTTARHAAQSPKVESVGSGPTVNRCGAMTSRLALCRVR